MNGGTTKSLLRAAIAIAAAGLILLVAMATLYVGNGARLLARMDLSVGEILMNEGMRFQESGASENAKERYRAALGARFAGEQNRILTLKLLGALYWADQDYERAVPLLEEAVASPHVAPTYFEPLCDSLYQLQRYDEVLALLPRWKAAAADRPDIGAVAAYFEGVTLLMKRRWEAAVAAFEAGNRLAPGGRNAEELARIYANRGELKRAMQYIDQYLATGAPGARMERMLALRQELAPLLEP